MLFRSDADPSRDAADRQIVLPAGIDKDGDESADGAQRRAQRLRRPLVTGLAVILGAGVLVGGGVALAAWIGADDSAPSGSAGSASSTDTDPAYAGIVADFEAFARGVDGVSDGDAAVLVEVVAGPDGEAPRGSADVLLDADGEGQIQQVAAALASWTSDAESAGRVTLDVRLTTAAGAVDLSRPASANAERLAVAAEVVQDPEIEEFWIGASRVDLTLAAGADREQGLQEWTERVAEAAPSMAVTVRTVDVG